MGPWRVITAATATAPGVERRDCTRSGCNEFQTGSIPATGAAGADDGEDGEDVPLAPTPGDGAAGGTTAQAGTSDDDDEYYLPGRNNNLTTDSIPDLEQIIEDGEIPLAPILRRQIPIFAPMGWGAWTWSVGNLVMNIKSIMLTLTVALYALLKKRQDNKDALSSPSPEHLHESGKGSASKITWTALVLGLGIVSAVMFLITQDMQMMMVLFDLWSIAHAAIIAAQVMALAFIFKGSRQPLSVSG